MEEDLILQQPPDRRIGNVSDLPLGPPGVEFDTVEYDTKPSRKSTERDASTKTSRRRSPSSSPPPRRKSNSRSRRSPSPVERRRRRSPSMRRNRFRDYSPDRRRYDGRSRRSPDRRRSPPLQRDRYRGGRSNRTSSPRRGGGGSSSKNNSRWSPPPKKKVSSPIANVSVAPNPPQPSMSQPPPSIPPQSQAQYNVMPPQMYGESYPPPPYNQFGVPPPQPGFPARPDAYGMQPPGSRNFNTAYPPPNTWGVNDAYAQQSWMQPVTNPNQMPQMQQLTPPTSGPPPQVQVPSHQHPHQQISSQSLNILLDNSMPITMEPKLVHDAVAQEVEHQRDELKRQRLSYLRKTAVLKKELKMLSDQRKDLNSGDGPPSPTTKDFIEENDKLKNQIEKKLLTIGNVIDMLTGLIGEENLSKEPDVTHDSDTKEESLTRIRDSNMGSTRLKTKRVHTPSTSGGSSSRSSSSSSTSSSSPSSSDDDNDSSPERLKNKVIESMKAKQKEVLKKEVELIKCKEEKNVEDLNRCNYVFYDPEMHWCQTCNVFPKTAKDYLSHLHTKEHMDRESIETPWHLEMTNDQYPTYENVPTKRTPIHGLTFFVPAVAWFCKLCNFWMGDLHCASSHLKSQLHSNKYNLFLEKNPHFEVNWLADRQRVLNEKQLVPIPPLPPQNTSVSTTAAEQINKNKDEEKKSSKKRKKKNSDKKEKKRSKKKHSKKRKKNASSSSSTSSDTSSSDSEPAKKVAPPPEVILKDFDSSNPTASIRVAMRKQESIKVEDDLPPPPPPSISIQEDPVPVSNASGNISEGHNNKWPPPSSQQIVMKLGASQEAPTEEDNKHDDAIIQQWNTVQPVISDSEKKLLEELKGKLKKNKSREETTGPLVSSRNVFDSVDKENREKKSRQEKVSDRRRRSRSPYYGGRGGKSRSRSRSRSRGRNYRRRSRSRSRSRGRRISPRGYGRRRRSRSRSLRRRSRSFDRRRRTRTRTRSRTRSNSRNRIEKPVIKHSEFRPRVPDRDKEREKDRKVIESKDKRDQSKKQKSSTTSSSSSSTKKLPFIGKMPVFKKQTTGQMEGGGDKRAEGENSPNGGELNAATATPFMVQQPQQRLPAPTAAQIQMAMMEDVYGNAPPFHPDAGIIVDYDDLMPDPLQFVNLMSQAPPPPPPPTSHDNNEETEIVDENILPPGIDETESEEFAPKPMLERPISSKDTLPKDLEEALNIIFPGERKPGDGDDDDGTKEKRENQSEENIKPNTETQIIIDEPIIHADELAKEGIHLVTMEETVRNIVMDEASQISMNEPLIFNKPNVDNAITISPMDDHNREQNDIAIDTIMDIPPPPPTDGDVANSLSMKHNVTVSDYNCKSVISEPTMVPPPPTEEIPIPVLTKDNNISTNDVYDLEDIPQPPPSPTESEKNRRQEELDDLAMLGIEVNDMAAQCM